MVENPPWLLDAVDKLIAKYSTPFKLSHIETGIHGCPLCIACGNTMSSTDSSNWCIGCPNNYFKDISSKYSYVLGCSARLHLYPTLNFNKGENYPNILEFWTIFRDLIKHGKSSDEAIQIILKDISK